MGCRFPLAEDFRINLESQASLLSILLKYTMINGTKTRRLDLTKERIGKMKLIERCGRKENPMGSLNTNHIRRIIYKQNRNVYVSLNVLSNVLKASTKDFLLLKRTRP